MILLTIYVHAHFPVEVKFKEIVYDLCVHFFII